MLSSSSVTNQLQRSAHLSNRLKADSFSLQAKKDDLHQATDFRLGSRSTAPAQSTNNSPVVWAGRRKKGSLKHIDEFNNLRQGRFADAFQVKGIQSGQQIHIKLNSREFDTYLQVIDQITGELIMDNDDQQSGVTNSRLTFIAQPDVQYGIKVTSFDEQEVGRYSLRVKAVQPKAPGFSYGSGLLDASKAVAKAANLELVANNGATDGAIADSEAWNVKQVNAPDAWAKGIRGKDVVVAVIDSGVAYGHGDLSQAIWTNPGEIPDNGRDDDGNGFVDDWRGWDFVQKDNQPGDANGHGTFISGIIAGQHNGAGVSGIAPEATIMPIRVLDQNGSGSQRDVAKGIRYAVQNGADVINLSLGGPPNITLERSLKRALKFAYREGVFVAIASGNDRQGYGSAHSGEPAYWASTRNYAISVGAVDESRQVSSYSNPRGNKANAPYVVAPGTQVDSILPWYKGRTFTWSGTSFATPHVAGVAALMLSANPALSPLELMGIITSSANPEGLSVV